MRILVDCDGVLADFTNHLLTSIGSELTQADITGWDFFRFLSKGQARSARSRLKQPDFWETQPVLVGAQAAVAEFRESGHHVVCVTSPWPDCKQWGYVRHEWLKRHFDFAPDAIVIASAKHLIEGDALIDDKATTVDAWRAVHGGRYALLFDAPYNQEDKHSDGDEFDRCHWSPSSTRPDVRHPRSWLAEE